MCTIVMMLQGIWLKMEATIHAKAKHTHKPPNEHYKENAKVESELIPLSGHRKNCGRRGNI